MIDLNSDLGEGYGAWTMGDDDALLGIVSSANIACGFHAGDPQIMRRAAVTAAHRGVTIGAHVAFPDLRGFGRRNLDLPPQEVTDDVLYQIGALDAIARAYGTRVSYVKPHGALYNRIAIDAELAAAVVAALKDFDPTLALLTLPDSAASAAAESAGIASVAEGFADRAYTPDGRLVSRREPGAVLTDPEFVAARAVRMATEHTVTAIDGTDIRIPVASLCVHGDSPGAVNLAQAVRTALHEAGVTVAAFSPPR
ncbi:LamB/YcsF family protein [Actinacidiphila oryziradicis]|uniref:5-oxoprolinase subunit A n=1 Tax=Actinacidiphila oryziradicis TaxID=2571141 RepID=A0A4U0RXS5_9ACTN|nr:5-oxoprolinase subunit PxpA [Actinacidiphila oryziradicis]TKA01172.1 LamB/YcsF family protein [Actinacidiphila oryziradicis]